MTVTDKMKNYWDSAIHLVNRIRFEFSKNVISISIGCTTLLLWILCDSQMLCAQSLSLDLGDSGGSFTGRLFQFIILITIISVAPSILLMATSFTRFVVVFSFLRSALGLQNSPPNQVLIGLAFFLTLFVMSPTLEKSYDQGMKPLIEERIDEETAFKEMAQPFHEFMRSHVREIDVSLFASIAGDKLYNNVEDIPLKVLVPAFMISELKRAFEIGFLIFLPFLIIDMVVASILMSLGMMMLPPVMIALPFKIIFFVMVDGWNLIVGSLVRGFG